MLKRTNFVVQLLLSMVLLICAGFLPSYANELNIPQPLEPWRDWVMQTQADWHCPTAYNQAKEHYCIWPKTLVLKLNDKGLLFSQHWTLKNTAWVPLPGEQDYWPQDVMVNNKVVPVSLHQGEPAVYLPAGEYELSGKILWRVMPQALAIPKMVALVQLSSAGQLHPVSRRNNKLLLHEAGTSSAIVADHQSIKVLRLLDDDVPQKMTTHLLLEVSGQPRTLHFKNILPDASMPTLLNSTLPARIAKNELTVQVRSGRWRVTIGSRFSQPVQQFSLNEARGLLPNKEWWVVKLHPNLQHRTLTGNAIDPTQSPLPKNWHRFNSYLMTMNQGLSLSTELMPKQHSDEQGLRLMRDVWLDFDGGGATYADALQGEASIPRLSIDSSLELGQVRSAGQAQLITRYQQASGVENRMQYLNLNTQLRQTDNINILEANGYDQSLASATLDLHLPPGWQVLYAWGADNNGTTWLNQWNLWDCFIVLLIIFAVYRLRGFPLAVLMACTLIIIQHQLNAPNLIWLPLLLSLALVNMAKTQRYQIYAQRCKQLSFLLLVLCSLPFLVQEIRSSLYPQLELQGKQISTVNDAPQEAMLYSKANRTVRQKAVVQSDVENILLKAPEKSLNQIPTEPVIENVQTGPGLPNWSWHNIHFVWSAPVALGQKLKLWLLTPWQSRIHHLLNALLVIASALALWSVRWRSLTKAGAQQCAWLFALGLIFNLVPTDAMASTDYPPQYLLKQLEQRLLTEPECQPNCAQMAQLYINNQGNELQLSYEVHASVATLVPIPAQENIWLPESITLDEKNAMHALRLKNNQFAVIVPKGVHGLTLKGRLLSGSVDLNLALVPHWVENLSAFKILGLKDNRLQGSQLSLRGDLLQDSQRASKKLAASEIKPFVLVQRKLDLGSDWRVKTVVRRVAPSNAPIQLWVDLLPGESVLASRFDQKGNQILVSLREGQNSTGWQSNLSQKSKLTLVATKADDYVEDWQLKLDYRWHVQYSGLESSRSFVDNQWQPRWQPWLGEKLELDFTRLKPADGQTMTIESVDVSHQAGRRLTDTALQLKVNASVAREHTILVPKEAKVKSVTIDGQAQLVRQIGQSLRLAIHPGQQNVAIKWQREQALTNRMQADDIDLKYPANNINTQMQLPENRWVLLLCGPQMGPAVLYWSLLLVVALAAFGLARIPGTPLRFHQWLLLGIGLSMLPLVSITLVVAWFFILAKRDSLIAEMSKVPFRLTQLGIILLTLCTILILVKAISLGLLGSPDMRIYGAGVIEQGYSSVFSWYQDKVDASLPEIIIWSLPIWVYRVLMLLWALWLAQSMIRWMPWAWQCFSKEGVWSRQQHLPAKL